MRVITLAIFFCSMLTMTNAFAQPDPAARTDLDKAAQDLMTAALDNFPQMKCKNFTEPCAPATAAERKNPPLSVDEARLVLATAYKNASAQLCGLDWQQKSFVPMLKYFEERGKKDRQMALVVFMNNIVVANANPDGKRQCDDEMRASVAKDLVFDPKFGR